MHDTLISARELQSRLADATAPLLVLDCSFDLSDPAAGERACAQAHVPSAIYLHLDRDLCAPMTGRNGRHPLPTRADFARRIAAFGGGQATQFVCYDRSGGMYAARAWWMLRWAGHAAAAVLDGGWQAWCAAGGAVQSSPAAARAAGDFALRDPLESVLSFEQVHALLGDAARCIVDARGADRFRGENETLDPVAGHIPGAVNRPFKDNLAPDGRFKDAGTLRAEWAPLLAGRLPQALVQQCGSGVTACHNLLALRLAGHPGSALYAGSWSEWCAQPGAPVALGAA